MPLRYVRAREPRRRPNGPVHRPLAAAGALGAEARDPPAGRGADVEGLGLEDAAVKLDDHGLIEVDGAMRTSREGVYAIGDVVHGPALAHKASDEGVIAAEDAAGMATHPIDYPYVPRVTFCMPQVASFGLTEAQARAAGHDGEIVGGHIVAPKAAELIEELVTHMSPRYVPARYRR